MNHLRFTWDERKNGSNKKKHSVSFEEAQTVFFDDNARLIHDSEFDNEERFILLGMSIKLIIMIVVHCYKESDEIIRIISARRATKNECNEYEEYLK